MKTFRLLGNLMFVACVTMFFVACNDDDELPPEVETVTIAPAGPISLVVGETAQLLATVLPTDAASKEVVWRSFDDGIVTVDNTGLVTAISAGEANITATAGDVTADCSVIVTAIQEQRELELNIDSEQPVVIITGGNTQIEIIGMPEGVMAEDVLFETSDASVADVSEDGIITATGTGEAVITVTAGEESIELQVEVKPVPQGWIKNSEARATYSNSELSMMEGSVIEVVFENGICTEVTSSFMFRSRDVATGIEALFPEFIVDAYSISGRGTVATVDMLKIDGIANYFTGKTFEEIVLQFGDNTAAIYGFWKTSLNATEFVSGNWTMPDINTIEYSEIDKVAKTEFVVTMEYDDITAQCARTMLTLGVATEKDMLALLETFDSRIQALILKKINNGKDVGLNDKNISQKVGTRFTIDISLYYPASDGVTMETLLQKSGTEIKTEVLSAIRKDKIGKEIL